MVGEITNTGLVYTDSRTLNIRKKDQDLKPEGKSYKETAEAYKTNLNREILKGAVSESSFRISGSDQEDFNTLVANLLARQGITHQEAMSGKTVFVDEETRQKAKDLVSEDGYWGVEKTASRIAEFAINAAGNDPARLEKMKGAVEKGFQMALDSFGGKLPEISHNTFNTIMEKLDDWAEKQPETTTA